MPSQHDASVVNDPLGDQAVVVFAAELAAERVPSIRAIRARLHVGQPRAQRLRDYLAAGAVTRAESPSVSISVYTPRLRTPLSSRLAQTAFGIPPIPIWRQSPSAISSAIRRPTARSISVGGGLGSSGNGARPPSMT